MKYYQFLYYNLIKVWRKKREEVENAPINGMITITFLPSLNLVTIPLVIMAVFGTSVFNLPTFNKLIVLCFFATFGFLNYWILKKNGKSKRIIERFHQLDSKKQEIEFLLINWKTQNKGTNGKPAEQINCVSK